jgi:hypothetical protein
MLEDMGDLVDRVVGSRSFPNPGRPHESQGGAVNRFDGFHGQKDRRPASIV